jgi:hypothetical protein
VTEVSNCNRGSSRWCDGLLFLETARQIIRPPQRTPTAGKHAFRPESVLLPYGLAHWGFCGVVGGRGRAEGSGASVWRSRSRGGGVGPLLWVVNLNLVTVESRA